MNVEFILGILLLANIIWDVATYLKTHQDVQAKIDAEVAKIKQAWADDVAKVKAEAGTLQADIAARLAAIEAKINPPA